MRSRSSGVMAFSGTGRDSRCFHFLAFCGRTRQAQQNVGAVVLRAGGFVRTPAVGMKDIPPILTA